MSMIKRILQDLYDDQQYCQKVIEEQVMLGKKYKFVEFLDRQDQRQWQDEKEIRNESNQ